MLLVAKLAWCLVLTTSLLILELWIPLHVPI